MSTTTQQNARNSGLTPAQRTAIAALLAGRRYGEAAEAAGVDESTLWRWRHESACFQIAWNQAQADLRTAIQARLSALGDKAVEAIAAIMAEPTASPGERLRAAEAILDRIGPLDQHAVTDARLAQVIEAEAADALARRRLLIT